jgi:signal transduction histidine kinase
VIHAPQRDGELTCRVLEAARYRCVMTRSDAELLARLTPDTGTLVIAEESLNPELMERLQAVIAAQPAWSDLPVLLVEQTQWRRQRLDALQGLGNVSVLSRPMSLDALLSAVRAAMRARGRQFEVRDLLRQQREQAERKDQFLAMLAHELRNPLAPIRYAAHMLQLPGANLASVPQLAALIERQVGHMGRIIDQLLDVSRVTRGLIQLDKTLFDLAQIAADAVASLSAPAASRGITLALHAPQPLWIEGDATRLRQVLDNLVDNAVKFSHAGGTVRVEARVEGDRALACVADEGDGIAPEMQPFIFEPFVQADRSLDRPGGGLGLGLSLVKGLVELHGGSVAVHSEGRGKGARFEVSLPLAAAEVPQRDAAAPQAGAAIGVTKVLIAEDNADSADTLRMVLEGSGYQVVVARSGPAALEAARRFAPQALVCDIGLPGMTGYEVAQALRAEQLRPPLMIAVTGYGTAEDKAAAERAGFDLHFAKPVAPATLLRALQAPAGAR